MDEWQDTLACSRDNFALSFLSSLRSLLYLSLCGILGAVCGCLAPPAVEGEYCPWDRELLQGQWLQHLSKEEEMGTCEAGNKRLQQIITAADPLAIQADVHWTHIREREAEERMLPTSESSTSRGNCLEPQSRVCVLSPHSWPFPWLQRPCLQRDHCPCLSFKNM